LKIFVLLVTGVARDKVLTPSDTLLTKIAAQRQPLDRRSPNQVSTTSRRHPRTRPPIANTSKKPEVSSSFGQLQIGSQSEIYKYILNFLLWMGRFLLNGLPISLIYRHLKAKSGFAFVVP
jgi:hypothetical protein